MAVPNQGNTINPRIEEVPERENTFRCLVHFDIDPSNILVGSFNPQEGGHDMVPIHKISDLGEAQFFGPADRRDAYVSSASRTLSATNITF